MAVQDEVVRKILILCWAGLPHDQSEGWVDVDRIFKNKFGPKEVRGELLRIDANQGYSYAQAEKFVTKVDPSGLSYLNSLETQEWRNEKLSGYRNCP